MVTGGRGKGKENSYLMGIVVQIFVIKNFLEACLTTMSLSLTLLNWAVAAVAQSLSHAQLLAHMACSTPGSPGLHCFPEFAQIHLRGSIALVAKIVPKGLSWWLR